MFQWILFTLFFVLVCIKILFRKNDKKFAKYPPGPPRYPLIGSLLSVLWADANDPSMAFHKLSKKYGPIVGLQMGAVPVVAINGSQMLSRVANSEDLLTRVDESDIWILEKTNSIPLGLIFALPELWAKTRQYALKNLRKYGFTGLTETSDFILQEIVDICDELKSQMTNGQVTLSLTNQFGKLFFNIIWMFLTGNRYGNAETGENLLQIVEEYMRDSKFTGSIVQIYPALVPLFPGLTGFNKLKDCCTRWRSNISAAIDEARHDGGYKTNPGNFLEDFLKKLETERKPKNLQESVFTEENLVAIFEDFTLAGMDTQVTTMRFLIRFLMENPDVQDKLHEEVDRVVGNSRHVNVDDIPNLKYVQATLAEVLRLGNVAPVIPRKLLKEWSIDDYVIPKGTLVILNIWSGDNDETVHKNPTKFDPNRFISEDGTLIGTDKLVAFGFGKRRCIGEPLVKTWLTLLTTSLVQNFSFHVDPKFGTSWGKETIGLTRVPAPYNVIIKTRDSA